MLTQWTDHLDRLTAALRERGRDPVVLRGGMGAKARAAALARLQPRPDGPPLLAVATGPYVPSTGSNDRHSGGSVTGRRRRGGGIGDRAY